MANDHKPHFLLVTFGVKGHMNPALNFAHRLTSHPFHIQITFVTPFSVGGLQDVEEMNRLLTFSHFSDGSEDGIGFGHDHAKLRMKESISALVLELAASGRPITCIIYTVLLTAAAEVASELGVPSALLWIQPAAVFTIVHHYFHEYGDLIAAHEEEPMYPVELPGLPTLKTCDLPSFLITKPSSNPDSLLHRMFGDMFRTLDRIGTSSGSRYPVLINTFQELEPYLVSGVYGMELFPVGPLVSTSVSSDSKERYMQWLDSKDEGSVVYISFGSLVKLSRWQIEEISRGLVDSGRPYIWALRKDEGCEDEVGIEEGGDKGMVVGWCSQMRVLTHGSVGCFVTHCGWNSTLEGMMCGVPMVAVPQRVDQPTNARLVEGEWGVGVRAEVGKEEGRLDGAELRRCVDVVMGERGVEMRKKAKVLAKKGMEAVRQGGSSFASLEAFLETQAVLLPQFPQD